MERQQRIPPKRRQPLARLLVTRRPPQRLRPVGFASTCTSLHIDTVPAARFGAPDDASVCEERGATLPANPAQDSYISVALTPPAEKSTEDYPHLLTAPDEDGVHLITPPPPEAGGLLLGRRVPPKEPVLPPSALSPVGFTIQGWQTLPAPLSGVHRCEPSDAREFVPVS